MQEAQSLSRIQREIKEVTEREREFREGRIERLLFEPDPQLANGHGPEPLLADDSPDKLFNKTYVIRQSHNLITPPSIPTTAQNGSLFHRRFKSNTRGMMQRFIANKGKLPPAHLTSPTSPSAFDLNPAFTTTPKLHPEMRSDSSPVVSTTEGKPVRKGFVPVEEKIQKELRDMKHREHELKRMRRKQKPFAMDLSDQESSSESEDEEVPPPGKLKPTKSLGELYEALGEEGGSMSRPGSGQGSLGSLKPAKSLAELCALAPGERFLAASSSQLIAQWESRIHQ